MRRAFRTFIGVDLGGGKGKTTALARLRLGPPPEKDGGGATDSEQVVIVEDLGAQGPWYDDRLIEYLIKHAQDAVVAIDAPLTLTACVRCVLPTCPGTGTCQVPTLAWFRERSLAADSAGDERRGPQGKPRYTPYTQRATEVVLHEDHGILPRETLGQGMGPLTARMAYLRHALSSHFRLNENLLEVYPKATLTQLFPDPVAPAPTPAADGQRGIRYKDPNGKPITLSGSGAVKAESQVARLYKRSGHALPTRTRVLDELAGVRFGPGQWREFAVQSDHQFDALICAYTAFLWTRDGWEMPPDPDRVFAEDGWIWFPPGAGASSRKLG